MDTGYALLLTAALMLSLWYFWFFEYKRYLVDNTRQKLFKIRNELFQSAVDGKIDFDEPLYSMTRTTLNGAIRFTHKISAWRLLGVIVLAKCRVEPKHVSDYKLTWKKSFSDVESETAKKTVLKAHSKMHLVLFQHLVSGSLVLRVLFFILAAIAFAIFKHKQIEKVVTSRKRREWSVIDAEANSAGQQIFVN